jgi:hypothetical protein
MLADQRWFKIPMAIGFAVAAIAFVLNSHERHRKLDRLQARIDALTVQLDNARKSIDQRKCFGMPVTGSWPGHFSGTDRAARHRSSAFRHLVQV